MYETWILPHLNFDHFMAKPIQQPTILFANLKNIYKEQNKLK